MYEHVLLANPYSMVDIKLHEKWYLLFVFYAGASCKVTDWLPNLEQLDMLLQASIR